MVSESTKCNTIIHNKFRKCEFCGQELKPKGLDYLYINRTPDSIEYERCNCEKAVDYWKQKDKEQKEIEKRQFFKSVIDKIYMQNYMGRRLQEHNFENFDITSNNEVAVNIAKDYTNKCIKGIQAEGIIITGESGVGKTHLAAAIANKLIENGKIVLMGRLSSLLDMIKDTFGDKNKSEKELIELYSNIDMIVIDDLGTEKISQWALEKLYTIIENRNENKLPIIITTRFDKNGLIERFDQSQDEELVDAVIAKLYQMCYGITLKNEKEKASTSDQTQC